MSTYTHDPYALKSPTDDTTDTTANPPAPPTTVDPEQPYLSLRHSQQSHYLQYSSRTQRCTRYDEETKSCPLGNRCYYYHTRKGKEHKRTFDMNRDCHLCTSDDVERWLDRQDRKNQQRHTPAGEPANTTNHTNDKSGPLRSEE
ncbi:hypothetical protein, conserved [Angomonas deanei]|uniref:C3H1-type domain-containing protein n=1 Tax=Angomonas deanei TaxID=59799 RepID=A0A7G2CCV9_9TRYP|nr:hypothetical protein, conserved [Angomonas deanei]